MSHLQAQDVADFLLSGLHGAILGMKVARGHGPLDVFRAITLAAVLAPPPLNSRRS